MAKIISARAYANNEVALLAWSLDEMIDGCLAFDIVRIRTDGVEAPKPLPAWVPFPGQANPNWKPQDTRVWPVQKLYWRDLTLRQHRSRHRVFGQIFHPSGWRPGGRHGAGSRPTAQSG